MFKRDHPFQAYIREESFHASAGTVDTQGLNMGPSHRIEAQPPL